MFLACGEKRRVVVAKIGGGGGGGGGRGGGGLLYGLLKLSWAANRLKLVAYLLRKWDKE
jgi:hypothetical protein